MPAPSNSVSLAIGSRRYCTPVATTTALARTRWPLSKVAQKLASSSLSRAATRRGIAKRVPNFIACTSPRQNQVGAGEIPCWKTPYNSPRGSRFLAWPPIATSSTTRACSILRLPQDSRGHAGQVRRRQSTRSEYLVVPETKIEAEQPCDLVGGGFRHNEIATEDNAGQARGDGATPGERFGFRIS